MLRSSNIINDCCCVKRALKVSKLHYVVTKIYIFIIHRFKPHGMYFSDSLIRTLRTKLICKKTYVLKFQIIFFGYIDFFCVCWKADFLKFPKLFSY